MSKYTISDILSEEELAGMTLHAGACNTGSEICNVNIIDNPDSYDWLSPGDLLLTTGYIFKDDEALQRNLIHELSEINCAGLAIKTRRYLNQIPKAMLEEAERCNFPLIEIPVQYPLSKICKVVLERLSIADGENTNRFISLYHAISEGILEPGGVNKVLHTVSEFIGNSVLLLGNKWEMLYYAEHSGNPRPLADELPLQRGIRCFPDEFITAMPKDFAKYTKAIKRTLPTAGEPVVCRVLPIAGANVMFGYLVVWETERKMQSVEYSALEIAVSTLTLERIKARQIEEIRLHLKQDFFDDLLEGKIDSADAINSMAGIHSLEADGTYLCVVSKMDNPAQHFDDYMQMQDSSLKLKESMIAVIGELAHTENRSCVSIHRGSLIISFLRVGKTEERLRVSDELRQFIQQMYQRMGHCDEAYVLNIGVGEPCEKLLSIRRSFSQAQEAIRVSESIYRAPGIYFYEDLIIYQLLDAVVADEKSMELYTLSIRNLVEYDRQNATSLVETLDRYFACNCNVSETAKELFIHRNTLIYRIEKIKSILGRDLKDSEELLLLQLGLKLHQIQKIQGSGAPRPIDREK